ncbi:UDP-2,3-diacylglucosamine hydrolase [Candidatus Photodesmus katoptron]|uniref:UDP-2,3-diacylglucosamine hydrolase n=1 Tax=Candidatus Photodesmus katoptron Akat1 TaxID=1236703 RepID=S3EGX3_9GAMM|nr:UDP-2,3-diacylglucosamine diphosphatase [Candidatus Photodesmus katoptron]EPE37418.1 UDP-2,3-diacylglucosamine hydrolase [Candidatus Photodesmus katoptron Akat1]KEY90828.1 UDP-2,3-diacylglucosamine hydrolase [Candidatus Photodesmus katoptron]
MTILFISDLHLTPLLPKITNCFIRFMREEASKADRVYVLGDLFDFWVGDDDNSSFATLIKDELKKLTSSGVPCFFIRGNRDFLIGTRFAEYTGIRLLSDEAVIDLYDRKAVILHGDTLCTRDVKYLKYRQKVRKPWLKWLFNCIPVYFKRIIINKIQSNVRGKKKFKSLDIMDVTASEVEKVFDLHNVDLMIHGHTHIPNIHQLNTDKGNKIRIVLGDWNHHGSILFYYKNRYELQIRPFD